MNKIKWLLSYSGRLNRLAFFLYWLAVSAIFVITMFVFPFIFPSSDGNTIILLFICLLLFFVYALSCLVVKRFHDLNKNNWYVLWWYPVAILNIINNVLNIDKDSNLGIIFGIIGFVSIPIVVLLGMILFFRKGTVGTNKYGDDLLKKKSVSIKKEGISRNIITAIIVVSIVIGLTIYIRRTGPIGHTIGHLLSPFNTNKQEQPITTTPVKTEIPSLETQPQAPETDLTYLSKLNGKYTSDFEFFENPLIRNKLIQLMGLNFSELETYWDVTSPVTVEGDIFMASACMAHNCSETSFLVAINIPENIFYVITKIDGFKTYYYEDNNNIPTQVTVWDKSN